MQHFEAQQQRPHVLVSHRAIISSWKKKLTLHNFSKVKPALPIKSTESWKKA
jgi:hypothetical protein